MIILLLIIFSLIYLFSILAYEFFNDWCFSNREFMNLHELRKYKNDIIISGCGASIDLDGEEWGIIFTPLNFWYFIYLYIINCISDYKYEKQNKDKAPWR